ncbi:MAG: hypothetical protein KDB73_02440 [Planctomycetes bacterium]|nr:hypothetical protein [Planctomycetota bacterium]
MRAGIEVETRSFVGSIDLDGLRIDLAPKMGLPRLMQMVARSYGLGDLTVLEPQLLQSVGQTGFVDLLGLALELEIQRLARRGLLQDYVLCEEEVSTPRGRMDLRRWASSPPSTRVLCRFETYTPDHDLHHVIRAGLTFAAGLVHDRRLRLDLARTAERFFPDVEHRRLTRSDWSEAIRAITRRTASYRRALGLIGILLDGHGVDSERTRGSSAVPAFLLDMNRLFERFLERELERSKARPFTVRRQVQDLAAFRWIDNPRCRRTPELRPDLLFTRRGRTLAVADAKYKDYDVRPLATADLYQVTAYAYACGSQEAAPVLMLYPTTSAELVTAGVLRFAGMGGRSPVRISVLGVPVTRMLEDATYDLGSILAARLEVAS